MKTFEEAAEMVRGNKVKAEFERFKPLLREIRQHPFTAELLNSALDLEADQEKPDVLEAMWAVFITGVKIGMEMEKQ